MADDTSFIKSISDSDAAQLVGLAANFGGTLQLAQLFISLFKESDTDKILNAIDQLRQDLERDFGQLGDLVRQQTQLVVNTVNRDTMALALSRSDVAASRIQEFLSNSNDQALEAAKDESIGGVHFFTGLGLRSPDLPFFLPGFVKAGTIRILVIAAEPMGLREPRKVVFDEVTLMVTFLASMIASIKLKVDAAHTVRQMSHSVSCPPFAELTAPEAPVPAGLARRIVSVIDGYSHEEVIEGSTVRLAFFDAQRGNVECEQPSGLEAQARSAASQARSQGVAAELAYIGIPSFEQILQSWRHLLTA